MVDEILPILNERGLYLEAQCCEHLNRALIMERAAAEKFGYEIVCVRRARKQAARSQRRSTRRWMTR